MGKGVEFCEDEFPTVRTEEAGTSKPASGTNTRPISSKKSTQPIPSLKNKDLIIQVMDIDVEDPINEENSDSYSVSSEQQ